MNSLILKSFRYFICLFLSLCTLLINPIYLYASESEAILAGGCFWCLEHDLEYLPGVISAVSGYSGGDMSNPTYNSHAGHQEAVLVRFDPDKISYNSILKVYFRNVDPFDNGGQFCDRGDSYKPVVFTKDEKQKQIALENRKEVSEFLKTDLENIKVKIIDAKRFWIAEDYHQDFAQRNNIKYNFYRYSCGRDQRLRSVWGEPE